MKDAIRLLLPYLKPYRRTLAFALAGMVGEIATAITGPLPFQRMIDTLVKLVKTHHGAHVTFHQVTPHLPRIALLSAAYLLLVLLSGLFGYLDTRGSARTSQLALTDLRCALFDHLQRLSLSFHHDKDTRLGELQTRLSGDVSNLQDVVANQLSTVVTAGGTMIFMLAALLLINWQIGSAVLVGAAPVYLLARHYRRQLRRAVVDARREEGQVTAILSESLSAARLVHVLGREAQEKARVVSATARELTFGLRAVDIEARFQPLLQLSTAFLTAVALVIAAVMVLQHQLTIGEMTIVLFYTRSALGSAGQLAKLPLQSQKAAASAERVSDAFARAPAVREPKQPKPLPAAPLDVEFDNVTFGYARGWPVLRGVSWCIPAGSTVALVGPTGVGKTTLLSLLPRLYDPWSGSVRLGGVDVAQVSFQELRAAVTLVLQDTLLFRDTVWNNIAYGRPEASADEILAAATAAGVGTFVDELEDGYKTIISERGATLSGGQKQCVAIARALLRQAPVVVMDEPTSNLDSVTEQLVIQGMNRLVRESTAIIIAHRLSTIRHANRVAVMEHGRIVQEGTPRELLDQPGLYARLSQYQQLDRVGMP